MTATVTVTAYYAEEGMSMAVTEFQEWVANRLAEIPEEFRKDAMIDIGSKTEYDCDYPTIEISYIRPKTETEIAEQNLRNEIWENSKRDEELYTLAYLQAKYGSAMLQSGCAGSGGQIYPFEQTDR